MTSILRTFARAVYRARQRRELSQRNLAEAAGIHVSVVVRLEASQHRVPMRGLRLETAIKLATALGLGVDDLLASSQRPRETARHLGYVAKRLPAPEKLALRAIIEALALEPT